MPATLQSAVVMAVMTIATVPFLVRDRLPVRATFSQWLGVAWLGVSDAANVGLFFGAYQRTSVAVAVLTHYLTPVFVALAAPIVLRERAHARTFVAVAIAFAGLCLLLQPWRTEASGLVGAAYGAGSAVFYASNVLVNKRLARAFSGSELMFFHGLVSTPLLFAMVDGSDVTAVARSSLVVVILGALGPGVLGGLFFVWGLRRIAASHASVLTLLEPFVAVIVAAALMNETLGVVGVLGGLLILAGALLVVAGGAAAAAKATNADRVDGLDSSA